jgi:formylglycine-generating enzyme
MPTCNSCGKITGEGKFCSFCGAPLNAPEAIQAGNFSTIIKAKDGSEMVLIPAGEFWMGSPQAKGRGDEHPQRQVFVQTFYMDKTLVTFDQFDRFCDETKTLKPDDSDWGRGDRPVIGVSWDDAVNYCKWADKRLPTEAEWERACRGGAHTEFFFGNDGLRLGDYAWYDDNSKRTTHPVAKKDPNPFGLYDMLGNVWEWCADWYDVSYYAKGPSTNPPGPETGTTKVLRGGAWRYNAFSNRCACRSHSEPGSRIGNCFGFRCAKSL